MDTESLNEYLQGIYMGIESFKGFENKCNVEDSLKALVSETNSMYHNHAAIISDRIMDLGGDPPKSLSMAGKMAEKMSEVKNIFVNTEEEIRDKAIESMKMGIDLEEKFLQNHPDIDGESKTLIQGTIKEDKDQLQKFMN